MDKKGHFTTICRKYQHKSYVQAAEAHGRALCCLGAHLLRTTRMPGPPLYQKHQQEGITTVQAPDYIQSFKHQTSFSDHSPLLSRHTTMQKSLPSSRLKQATSLQIPSQDLISEYSLLTTQVPSLILILPQTLTYRLICEYRLKPR